MAFKRLFVPLAIVGSTAFGQVTVGVKNFRQLLASYATITGVDPNDADISAYYNQSKTRLPKAGRASEVSSPMLLTAAALGSLFCQKMIAADAALDPSKRRAHQQVDFTKGTAALTPAVQKSVIADYAGLFWQRPATDSEMLTLLGVFANAPTGTTPDTTQTSLTLVCTSVAASLASLVD